MKVNAARRVEIGFERRKRTLETILTAIVRVLDRQKFEISTIDEFIVEAGISRGTFYNYFNSKEDVAHIVATLLNLIIEKTITRLPSVNSELESFALSVVTYLDFAAKAPNLAEVMFHEYLASYPRDRTFIATSKNRFNRSMQEGMRTGEFDVLNPDIAVDIVAGALAFLIARIVSSTHSERQQVTKQGVLHLLMALGVEKDDGKKAVVAAMERIPLADTSRIDEACAEMAEFMLQPR